MSIGGAGIKKKDITQLHESQTLKYHTEPLVQGFYRTEPLVQGFQHHNFCVATSIAQLIDPI